MSILSLEFLLFAVSVIVVYYALPLKIRWLSLLIGSGVFLALSGWENLAYLSAVSLLTWGGARLLNKAASPNQSKQTKREAASPEVNERRQTKDKPSIWRKILLALLLTMELGAMTFLKFAPEMTDVELFLPLGLSYYTFMSAGFLIDIYRGKAEASANPLRVWLFLGYFPQLAQGPISSWKELGESLREGHRFDMDGFVAGFTLLLWGYFKKMVIADRLAVTTEALLAGSELPGWFALGGVTLYTIRLYMDFSGGMDVVRGLSRMLGVELPENFRRPFFARSVGEYWRRWHITLGTWFRGYLLFPLTTSRAGVTLGRAASGKLGKKTGRSLSGALGTVLVFLLIGLWHGASWNAVIYGAYFGVLLAASMLLEPLWKTMRSALALPKGGWMTPLRLIRTWMLILPAQYFAFTASTEQSWLLLCQTMQPWSFEDFSVRMVGIMSPLEWSIAGVGCALVLAADLWCEKKGNLAKRIAEARLWVRWPILLLLLLAILVFGIYGAGFDGAAFLYTQF